MGLVEGLPNHDQAVIECGDKGFCQNGSACEASVLFGDPPVAYDLTCCIRWRLACICDYTNNAVIPPVPGAQIIATYFCNCIYDNCGNLLTEFNVYDGFGEPPETVCEAWFTINNPFPEIYVLDQCTGGIAKDP